jgi:hypothetical protein
MELCCNVAYFREAGAYFGLARDSPSGPVMDDSVSPTRAQPLTRHGSLEKFRAHPKYRELTARMNLPIVLNSSRDTA